MNEVLPHEVTDGLIEPLEVIGSVPVSEQTRPKGAANGVPGRGRTISGSVAATLDRRRPATGAERPPAT